MPRRDIEKLPAVDLLRLKVLRGTKTEVFFIVKRYDEHPRPFYMGVAPPPLPPPPSRVINTRPRAFLSKLTHFLKFLRLVIPMRDFMERKQDQQ